MTDLTKQEWMMELEDLALITAITLGPTVAVFILIILGIFGFKFLDFAIHL